MFSRAAYCSAIGVPFDEAMLSWEPGWRPEHSIKDASAVLTFIVACVRLPEQDTDLLITVNQTLVVAPGSSAVAPDAGRGDALVTIERALATVRVADWGLFG